MAAIDPVAQGTLFPTDLDALVTVEKNLVLDPTVSLLVFQVAQEVFDKVLAHKSATLQNYVPKLPSGPIFISSPERLIADVLEARKRNDSTLIRKIVHSLLRAVKNLPVGEDKEEIRTTIKLLKEPKKESTLSATVLLFQFYVARKLQDENWMNQFIEAIDGLTIVTPQQLNEIFGGTYCLDNKKIQEIQDSISRTHYVKLPDGNYVLECCDGLVPPEVFRVIEGKGAFPGEESLKGVQNLVNSFPSFHCREKSKSLPTAQDIIERIRSLKNGEADSDQWDEIKELIESNEVLADEIATRDPEAISMLFADVNQGE